jgi:hypothetical protein
VMFIDLLGGCCFYRVTGIEIPRTLSSIRTITILSNWISNNLMNGTTENKTNRKQKDLGTTEQNDQLQIRNNR